MPVKVAPLEVTRGAYTISTDPERLDLGVIVDFLRHRSYWARGVTEEQTGRSIRHSLPFGIYHGRQLVGFARVITDHTHFAYLADVFVLETYREQGLGKWLIETILAHPHLQGLRRWTLATEDAHGLYRRFGFLPLPEPQRWMERKKNHGCRHPGE